jgi:hypothetical protein
MGTMAESQKSAMAPPSFTYWSWRSSKICDRNLSWPIVDNTDVWFSNKLLVKVKELSFVDGNYCWFSIFCLLYIRILTILNTLLISGSWNGNGFRCQEAQKDNLRNFTDYPMKVLEVSVILPFISWHTYDIFSIPCVIKGYHWRYLL